MTYIHTFKNNEKLIKSNGNALTLFVENIFFDLSSQCLVAYRAFTEPFNFSRSASFPLRCPRHCHIAITFSILPQDIANHLPSTDLDFLTKWLHLSSLKQVLSPDMILLSDTENSARALVIEYIN
jgi:hypothetical protein